MSGIGGTDHADLAAKLAAREEGMETRQAEYKTDIAQLKADMASRLAALENVIVRSQKENADRSFLQLLATAGFVAGAVAILGFLIRT